jgi:hypothetical protein
MSPARCTATKLSTLASKLIIAETKEALDNRAEPRDNASVIAGGDWVHGRQAAWIR